MNDVVYVMRNLDLVEKDGKKKNLRSMNLMIFSIMSGILKNLNKDTKNAILNDDLNSNGDNETLDLKRSSLMH